MNSATDFDRLLLWLTIGELALAAAYIGARVWRTRQRIGAAVVSDRSGRFARLALFAALLASAAGLVLIDVGELRFPAWIGLALCAVIAALQPARGDSIYSERGVRRGWLACSFAELEEWRLTGEHLRWKLGGEWLACRVPTALHADLRAKLALLCPERESPFKS